PADDLTAGHSLRGLFTAGEVGGRHVRVELAGFLGPLPAAFAAGKVRVLDGESAGGDDDPGARSFFTGPGRARGEHARGEVEPGRGGEARRPQCRHAESGWGGLHECPDVSYAVHDVGSVPGLQVEERTTRGPSV